MIVYVYVFKFSKSYFLQMFSQQFFYFLNQLLTALIDKLKNKVTYYEKINILLIHSQLCSQFQAFVWNSADCSRPKILKMNDSILTSACWSFSRSKPFLNVNKMGKFLLNKRLFCKNNTFVKQTCKKQYEKQI